MRLIDAEPLEQWLGMNADKKLAKNPYENAKICAFRRAFELVLYAPTISPAITHLPNQPIILNELQAIVEKLEFCRYECDGGPLENNIAFVRLKELAYSRKQEDGTI